MNTTNSTPQGSQSPQHGNNPYRGTRTHYPPRPNNAQRSPADALDRSLEKIGGSSAPRPQNSGFQRQDKFRNDRNRRPRSGGFSGPRPEQKQFEKKEIEIPPLAPGDLRIIPIGGTEQIGQNMTMVEYKDQIVVIDAGIQFRGEDTPGIQYIIPDTTYLAERKDKIKALVITHGHLDHIGSIPYVMESMGNPPIYTCEFGALLIKKRQEEFPHLPALDVRLVATGEGSIRLSEDLKVTFFGLSHSIPDSTGVIIETPLGDIVSTGDVRVENIDGVPVKEEVEQYKKVFTGRKVILMTMDSTGIPVPGWSDGETIVIRTIDELLRDIKGRIFVGTFASQVERIIEIIKSAKKYGRYVVVEGRSMKQNVGIVEQLRLTELDHVIPVEDMHKYPPDKIVILATGSQGEQYALLDRVANGIHKFIKLSQHDTIIFSSSMIPGNERAIENLKDRLYRLDPNIITYTDTQVHSSGHGRRSELQWIHSQIDYKYFMPIHGSHYRLKMHRDMIVKEMGFPKENIVVPENGAIIEIREGGAKIVKLEARASHNLTIIDGNYVGPAHQVVLRDRKTLSEEGIFTIIVTLDQRTHALKKSPDINSRGFIYLRDNQDLLHKVRGLAKKIVEAQIEQDKHLDISNLKDVLGDKVQKFLFQKTGKKPIVTAVIIAL